MNNREVIIKAVSKILVPLILLFALYVQFHGDFGPGGGFQAGAIFSAGFVLYSLVFGFDKLVSVVSPRLLELISATGVLLYIGVGFLCMVLGGEFLNYSCFGRYSSRGAAYWYFACRVWCISLSF